MNGFPFYHIVVLFYYLRYLRYKYKRGDAETRYAEGLRIATYAREAEEIQKFRIAAF